MQLPETDLNPPFRITRASHSVLNTSDLGKARAFYVDTLGFAVSDETADTLYLRGLEEIAHHSIVLRTGLGVSAERAGFRCFTEGDLEMLKAFFESHGLPVEWVEVPHQGRTLHASDAAGAPLEFCASMETKPRLINRFDLYQGIRPLRLDHFQLFVPDVAAETAFYADMGFRLSEYIVFNDGGNLLATFMQRKGNPHDIVFLQAPGPRLHHSAFTAPEASDLMHIGDLLVQHGFHKAVEWGPNRHWGPGWARSIYLVDPDGHRCEFFNNHYQMIDLEERPVQWTVAELQARPGWGAAPPQSWQTTAMSFRTVAAGASKTDNQLGAKNPFEAIVDH